MQKSTWQKWVLTAIALVWCIIIWQFSLTAAASSSATSGAVRTFLNHILASIGIDFQFSAIMVRKMAHFIEFFALGLLTLPTLRAYRISFAAPLSLATVILVAAIDECIQLFVPGRGPGILDVLVDSFGGLCGILVALFCHALYKKIKKSK